MPPITASYVYYFDHNQSILRFSHCLHTLSFNFSAFFNATAHTIAAHCSRCCQIYPVILKMVWKILTELRSAQFKLAWIISGLSSKPAYPSIAHILIRIAHCFSQFKPVSINLNTTFHSLHTISLTDRECVCFVVAVFRCYACRSYIVCVLVHMCVRVSVSFTSTVNYVGIHIAQHNKITNR